ncbi:hypothetical protein FHG64_18085 [Antarcticibacterium flavum]|uniref:Uncharacterized protein n=1 Tax=Antarcticibacterium flavum TaxID=2058175 RepID=A0A5B7X6X5_9FLAO|nr:MULTISPECIES: DUF6155 family protein [Antarcticibacterium]MCM4161772.1 hypothetical protein [Antarcticibacterium sp. W02-3]QCY71149.1 hypothetical protein FHG64_18085 [Antarcticibacterium flavum]
MPLKEVQKELNGMDKPELVKIISEMYNKIPAVKTYLDFFATGEIEKLAAKYKKEIEKYIYPSGRNLELRETEARKVIRSVQKMKITELIVELELHYVSCCLEVIEDFDYWEENYYKAMEKMFYSALSGITALGMEEKCNERIIEIVSKASDSDIELSY